MAGPAARRDVVVIGGGPAGCAAAITAARAGARATLLERDPAPRDRPGETLHPGVEPLLDWLGAARPLADATLARHRGHWIVERGVRRFEAFGADAAGPWRGFQARRRTLDAGLRDRAAAAGVEVRTGTAAAAVTRDRAGRVTGVTMADGRRLRAGVVVDAAGGRHWLARRLGVGMARLSPRYVASYGYVAGAPAALAVHPRDPELRADRAGWTWIAPLGERGWHWTRLSFAGRAAPRGWRPAPLAGLPPSGPIRGADVTWRIARVLAGPGWLLAGDAGAVLDPAASHGVLRALMSGARAGALAAALSDGGDAAAGPAAFDAWFRSGVERDVGVLRACYAAWTGARPDATR